MRIFIFILSLAGASFAQALPANIAMAGNELGLCGVSLQGLFAAKAFFRYATLPSSEILSGTPQPDLCADAVKRLDGITARTAEESSLLGAAAAGWLSASLKVHLDKDNKGDIEGVNVQDPAVISDTEVLAVMDAQRAFLKSAALLKERPDFAEIAANIRKSCKRHPACDLDPGDRSAWAVQTSRDLLQDLLTP